MLKKLNPRVRLKVIAPFFDWPEYVDAVVASAGEHLAREFDHLLFSYHGLPERHVKKSDPTGAHCLLVDNCCEVSSTAHATCYRHQVLRTTELVAERAGIPNDRHSVAFQSRLGRDRWLTPATADEIPRLARTGVKRLFVICPAFVTDCLETLEEIGIGGKEAFVEAGGEHFELIPCLNDHPVWIDVLTQWCSGEDPKLLSEPTLSMASR
jgi:ferrochelatase